ncbi:hypothetical protein IAU59_005856 [Kwoniella sp. CBS 9459]
MPSSQTSMIAGQVEDAQSLRKQSRRASKVESQDSVSFISPSSMLSVLLWIIFLPLRAMLGCLRDCYRLLILISPVLRFVSAFIWCFGRSLVSRILVDFSPAGSATGDDGLTYVFSYLAECIEAVRVWATGPASDEQVPRRQASRRKVPRTRIISPALAPDVPQITLSRPAKNHIDGAAYNRRPHLPGADGYLAIPIIQKRSRRQRQVEEAQAVSYEDRRSARVEKKVTKTFEVWQDTPRTDEKETREERRERRNERRHQRREKKEKKEDEADLETRFGDHRQLAVEDKVRESTEPEHELELELEQARLFWEQAEQAQMLWLAEEQARMAVMPYHRRMARSAGMAQDWGDSRGSFGFSYVQQRYGPRAFGGGR